jgi:hypothetical protein
MIAIEDAGLISYGYKIIFSFFLILSSILLYLIVTPDSFLDSLGGRCYKTVTSELQIVTELTLELKSVTHHNKSFVAFDLFSEEGKNT